MRKVVAEYLEHASRFARMAAAERDPKLKAQLSEQAEAYYKLAARRAKSLGLAIPPRAATKPTSNSEPTAN
jgi:hypothetical protein